MSVGMMLPLISLFYLGYLSIGTSPLPTLTARRLNGILQGIRYWPLRNRESVSLDFKLKIQVVDLGYLTAEYWVVSTSYSDRGTTGRDFTGQQLFAVPE